MPPSRAFASFFSFYYLLLTGSLLLEPYCFHFICLFTSHPMPPIAESWIHHCNNWRHLTMNFNLTIFSGTFTNTNNNQTFSTFRLKKMNLTIYDWYCMLHGTRLLPKFLPDVYWSRWEWSVEWVLDWYVEVTTGLPPHPPELPPAPLEMCVILINNHITGTWTDVKNSIKVIFEFIAVLINGFQRHSLTRKQ